MFGSKILPLPVEIPNLVMELYDVLDLRVKPLVAAGQYEAIATFCNFRHPTREALHC